MFDYIVEEDFESEGTTYKQGDIVELPDCIMITETDENGFARRVCAPLRLIVDRSFQYIVANANGFDWEGRHYGRGEEIALRPDSIPEGIELCIPSTAPEETAIQQAIADLDAISSSSMAEKTSV